MGQRGVLFAIEEAMAQRLLSAAGDDDAVMVIIEEVEEAWDQEHLAETDKAWDAMHRALTDGTLEFGNGDYPLSHVVLGGRELYDGEDYIAILKSADEVRDVHLAMQWIDDGAMARRYDTIVPRDYDSNYGNDDREYVVDYFGGVRELYGRAAAAGRWALFTVDQ